MSLTTSYWGEAFWKTMYAIAYTFPSNPSDEYQKHTEIWYESMAQLLPCEECRQHFGEYLDQHPIQNFSTCQSILLRWVNTLENAINKKMHKPAVSLETRIAEMDRSNPTIQPQHPRKIPCRNVPRRSGAVSHSIRRVNTIQSNQATARFVSGPLPPPQTHIQNIQQPTSPKNTRSRGTVSYAMRKPNPRRGGRCASCH